MPLVASVPLRSKRREKAQAFQKFQHAIPAVPLLMAGVQAIRNGEHGFALALGFFEVATSVALLGTVVREIRAMGRPKVHTEHAHHGVDWVHIFAAAVLVAEVLEHYHVTGHIRRPTILTAIVTLALGLGHGRLQRFAERRRVLRVEDDHLHVAGRPFRTLRARWADVSSIEVGEKYAQIRTVDGRERKLDLSDLHGAEHVRTALAEAQRRAAEARATLVTGPS
jgi:hypothetical protein